MIYYQKRSLFVDDEIGHLLIVHLKGDKNE